MIETTHETTDGAHSSIIISNNKASNDFSRMAENQSDHLNSFSINSTNKKMNFKSMINHNQEDAMNNKKLNSTRINDSEYHRTEYILANKARISENPRLSHED